MRIDYVLDFLPTYVLAELAELARRGHRPKVHLSGGDDFWKSLTGDDLPPGVEKAPAFNCGWLRTNALVLPPAALARFLPLLLRPGTGFLRLARQALSCGCLRFFLCGAELATRMMRDPPDRIHSHFAWTSAHAAMWASRLLGVPFSLTVHAADIFTPVSERRVRLLLEASRPPITISRFNIEYIRGRWGSDVADLMAMTHLGIPLPPPSRAVTAEGPPTIFCTASGLAEKKGVRILLEACSMLAARRRDWRCVIAGSDPDGGALERFRALTARSGLGGLVRFAGNIPSTELMRAVSGAGLFVLPCVRAESGDMDGIPVSLMEAMGMGLPVISSRISGVPELIEDGVSGLLVEPGDPSALASAIERLLDDPELADSLGREASRRVAEGFSVESYIDALERAWASIQPSARRTVPADE